MSMTETQIENGQPATLYVWNLIKVTYCHDEKAWFVTGVIKSPGDEKTTEILSFANAKSDAMDDAWFYAFDTSCGPQRAPLINVYTKAGQLSHVVAR